MLSKGSKVDKYCLFSEIIVVKWPVFADKREKSKKLAVPNKNFCLNLLSNATQKPNYQIKSDETFLIFTYVLFR